jgi:hypothetical protein
MAPLHVSARPLDPQEAARALGAAGEGEAADVTER